MQLLYEYEAINDKHLKTAIQNNPKLQKYFSNTWGVVKPKNYCGLLHIDGEDYYILPNLDINKLEIYFDHLNQRYKKSFEIAIMILKRYNEKQRSYHAVYKCRGF